MIARYNAGHQIAAHTWTHPDITTITSARFEEELTLLETALQKILGIKPKYFRPPYGSYNSAALAILKQRGYTVVTWNFDSGDSVGATTSQSIKSYSNIHKYFPMSVMAVNHEAYPGTYKTVVPSVVVPGIIAAGWKLVTVAQCMGDSHPYQSVSKAGVRDSTWTCTGTPSGRL